MKNDLKNLITIYQSGKTIVNKKMTSAWRNDIKTENSDSFKKVMVGPGQAETRKAQKMGWAGQSPSDLARLYYLRYVKDFGIKSAFKCK